MNKKLRVMTSNSGMDLTYRNSSEKVYGLANFDYKTAEHRAIWVSVFAGDMPNFTTVTKFKEDAKRIIDNMLETGMNALVFHIRTHCNALYKSDLNPIASWWSDVDFDIFDPLEWLIAECRLNGIEFHAWLNPYRIGHSFISGNYPNNHPATDQTKQLINEKGAILDPGLPEVRDYIIRSCMEVVERYDIDALNFDDYFYISNINDKTTYEKHNINHLEIDDFRREQVNIFIETLSKTLRDYNKVNNRAVQLGISPSGVYRSGDYHANPEYNERGDLVSPSYSNTATNFIHYGNYLYSDTKKWIDEEWIDYITPQAYWGMEHNGVNFYELTKWWSWVVRNKKVNLYIGLGVYMALGSTSSGIEWQKNINEIENEILNAASHSEIKGIVFFKYSSIFNIQTGVLTTNPQIVRGIKLLQNDYWHKRIPGAIVLSMADRLSSNKITNLIYNKDNQILSWDKIDNIFGYVIYQTLKGQPVNKESIEHLFAYIGTNNFKINIDEKYDYYVATVNRANIVSDVVKLS